MRFLLRLTVHWCVSGEEAVRKSSSQPAPSPASKSITAAETAQKITTPVTTAKPAETNLAPKATTTNANANLKTDSQTVRVTQPPVTRREPSTQSSSRLTRKPVTEPTNLGITGLTVGPTVFFGQTTTSAADATTVNAFTMPTELSGWIFESFYLLMF